MIHPSIQKYIPQVIELCKKHKVESAYIFGSAVTNQFTEQSDVDFLVNMQKNLDPVEMGGHLTYELQELLNRHVDLLTERSLKNPYFISEVSKSKFALYE